MADLDARHIGDRVPGPRHTGQRNAQLAYSRAHFRHARHRTARRRDAGGGAAAHHGCHGRHSRYGRYAAGRRGQRAGPGRRTRRGHRHGRAGPGGPATTDCRSKRCATTPPRPVCTTSWSTTTSRPPTPGTGGSPSAAWCAARSASASRSWRARPAVTHRVTLECAGNGRARLSPRPVSQPWLVEAVGTADWTGVPLAALLAEAGPADGAVEAVFTGADHGVERGTEQDYRRSLPLPHAADPDRGVLVAYAMNGAPLPPQHGHPLRLVVPGWYGMASVKWLRDVTLTATPFTGFQQAVAYRYRQGPDEPGAPVDVIAPGP
ncbi:molybdopterin-dependent oxidoreductase [Streptomyces showdoensis]|uniref:molybdopterin-dependent oxidoreductase n=1 Tax=Streptomyces showdoensis TaxID=68268 RepID=UPI0031E88DFC